MKGRIIKVVAFALSFLIVFAYFTRMMTPEFFVDNSWPTTATYQGFYKMKKNSIEVLFLGSSASATAFIPQELYNTYGITSYNISCEQQSLFTSYYWLKEALRFQTPKVVVLESKLLFPIKYTNKELNSTEGCIRKAFDTMKWSKVKKEAIEAICEIDESQTKISYYFPIIRFHSRWSELSKVDFLSYYFDMSKHYELKGYTPFSTVATDTYMPIQPDSSVECEKTLPLMQEYLDKIVTLCEQNKILLILTYTPSTTDSVAKNHTLNQYAEKNNLFAIDFNNTNVYEQMKYDYSSDNQNSDHANLWGAIKITDYIGQILKENYGLESKTEEQWESTRRFFDNLKADYGLGRITNIDEYFEVLNTSLERYSIFLSVKDEATSHLSEHTILFMRNMGLKADLEAQFRCSYLAVISNGAIIEESGYKILEKSGAIEKSCKYTIKSAGMGNGNMSSILINGIEYSKNSRGLNIVVYNNETEKVIDRVAFDTFAEHNKAIR